MSALDDMIVAGRHVKGARYVFWGGGPLEDCEPMYMDCPGADVDYVFDNGINCSGLLNWMQDQIGFDNKGGTLHYGNIIDPWENFDPSRWYPVGTLCVDQFTGDSEGHVVMITRPNQLCLQATVPGGVNENLTPAQQHQWTPFEWAGWLPGIPAADGLPGWGNGGVDGYPGDTATPIATARWMARVAERIYGLPGILPVMTSCVELTDAWTSEGDVKDVPGYLYSVDHDSYGWFQQRPSQGWGTREQILDPEYALSKFLDAALREKPEPVPVNPEGLGDWCQAVQRSGVPEAYAEKGYPIAVGLLGEPPTVPIPEPTGPGTEPVEPNWRRFGWVELHGPGRVRVYEGEGSNDKPDWQQYGWIELGGRGGATVHEGEG